MTRDELDVWIRHTRRWDRWARDYLLACFEVGERAATWLVYLPEYALSIGEET